MFLELFYELENIRKGIILAGGSGSRLWPLTKVLNKQLIPVFDKPMIYYPLTTLMLANIKDILLITDKKSVHLFNELLGDGESLGISLKYAIQDKPNGLAEAFIIGSDFIKNDPVALILGDNIFHGSDLISKLNRVSLLNNINSIFAYQVSDPKSYGVVTFNKNNQAIEIEEKPENPKSNFAITGIYFYDNNVVEKAKKVNPSLRGELEISAINQMYLKEGNLSVETLGRGTTWLDTGTIESLHEAASYIRTIEHRQGLKIGCPQEVSWRKGWINDQQLLKLAFNENYKQYFMGILKNK